eukprot:363132-Chlamydomonas_euryale.AAC.1
MRSVERPRNAPGTSSTPCRSCSCDHSACSSSHVAPPPPLPRSGLSPSRRSTQQKSAESASTKGIRCSRSALASAPYAARKRAALAARNELSHCVSSASSAHRCCATADAVEKNVVQNMACLQGGGGGGGSGGGKYGSSLRSFSRPAASAEYGQDRGRLSNGG